MIYQHKPGNFNTKFESVSCIIYHRNDVLLLERSSANLSYPLAWGVPTGKKEKNETINKAIIREVFEETSIQLMTTPLFINQFYVRYPEYDFNYYLFYYKLNSKPKIMINPKEHSSYQWINIKKMNQFNLIPGMKDCFDYFLKWKSLKDE